MNEMDIKLPLGVTLECSIVSETQAGVLIDIGVPHGITDVRGQTRFRVSVDVVAE